MSRVRIDGIDDVMREFERAPGEILKASLKASRAAARDTAKSIKKRIPSRWAKLTSSKVKKSREGQVYGSIGLFNREGRGNNIPDWFKAYWFNYGTLEGRDPSHRFDNPVRKAHTVVARRNKNKGGIKAQNFFEHALAGWEDTFAKAFQERLEKEKYKLANK